MCNYIIERNNSKRQCKLAKNKEICHIHKNMKPKDKNEFLDDLKIFNLENKNSKLEKRVNKLLTFQEHQKVELTNLYKTIEKKNKTLKEKEEYFMNIILKLQNTINTMKDDYDNYQYIIKYEKNKQELINKGINIYNYNNDEFHKNRQTRNFLAHRIN